MYSRQKTFTTYCTCITLRTSVHYLKQTAEEHKGQQYDNFPLEEWSYLLCLHSVTEHDNASGLVLPDHEPEVIDGVGQRSLSSDEVVTVLVSLKGWSGSKVVLLQLHTMGCAYIHKAAIDVVCTTVESHTQQSGSAQVVCRRKQLDSMVLRWAQLTYRKVSTPSIVCCMGDSFDMKTVTLSERGQW